MYKQQGWWSRRRRLPSSNTTKATSFRTKKETEPRREITTTTNPKEENEKSNRMARWSNFKDIFFFFFSFFAVVPVVLDESSHDVNKDFVKERERVSSPALKKKWTNLRLHVSSCPDLFAVQVPFSLLSLCDVSADEISVEEEEKTYIYIRRPTLFHLPAGRRHLICVGITPSFLNNNTKK